MIGIYAAAQPYQLPSTSNVVVREPDRHGASSEQQRGVSAVTYYYGFVVATSPRQQAVDGRDYYLHLLR